VFGSNGLIGQAQEFNAPAGTTIIGRVGSFCGSLHYSKQPCWVTDNAIKATSKSPLENTFWFYALTNRNLNDLSTGSGQPLINQTALKSVQLPVPPFEDRVRIGAILSSFDDKIELNRRMNETLEALTQAIFKDWFVDFGPVRRKQEGATDAFGILGGLIRNSARAAEVAAIFPNSFGDDRLPEGWDTYSLDELATLSKASLSPSKTPDQVFEHHSLPAYDKGEEPVTETGSSIMSNKFLVPSDSVLLSKLNPEISRVWVPNPKVKHTQIASTEFLVLVPRQGFGRSLLCAIFRDPTFRAGLEGMVIGTSKSHQRISPTALMAKEIVSGELRAFIKFESLAAHLLEMRLSLRSEIRGLAETRDYLLPKLMSGEVRVHDAQKLAE
tara:strand:- start:2976 stop:4127 length:1152 start_codon:yes stop_codon:yes gene_type:complete